MYYFVRAERALYLAFSLKEIESVDQVALATVMQRKKRKHDLETVWLKTDRSEKGPN
jgi:hypothetical protein